MDSIDELKEIDIKNRICYYFLDIMRVRDFDFYNILIIWDLLDHTFLKTYLELWHFIQNFYGCKTIAY